MKKVLVIVVSLADALTTLLIVIKNKYGNKTPDLNKSLPDKKMQAIFEFNDGLSNNKKENDVQPKNIMDVKEIIKKRAGTRCVLNNGIANPETCLKANSKMDVCEIIKNSVESQCALNRGAIVSGT